MRATEFITEQANPKIDLTPIFFRFLNLLFPYPMEDLIIQ